MTRACIILALFAALIFGNGITAGAAAVSTGEIAR